MALRSTGSLVQESEMDGTSLINACNGCDELSHLLMLWTVKNCWFEGARFAFN